MSHTLGAAALQLQLAVDIIFVASANALKVVYAGLNPAAVRLL